MKILMISGSRNPEGQTARAANAVLAGAEKTGCEVERVFLPVLKIERCRQCNDKGWGLCSEQGRCVIEDDFASLVEKMRTTDAFVVATPVYYSDLSESLRAFLDRLRRTCSHETGRASPSAKDFCPEREVSSRGSDSFGDSRLQGILAKNQDFLVWPERGLSVNVCATIFGDG